MIHRYPVHLTTIEEDFKKIGIIPEDQLTESHSEEGNELTELDNPQNPRDVPSPDPSTLGGNWMLIERDDGIEAVLWFFHQVPHAFVDYWAATYPRQALALGYATEQLLRSEGVRYIHGIIHEDNEPALKMAQRGLGLMSGATYHRVYKDI